MPDLTWRKSSYSGNTACIEVAWLDSDRMLIRNSTNPGPAIIASRAEWEAFLKGVRVGEFDHA